MGGKFLHPVDTNMVWLDLKDAKCSDERMIELAKEAGLRLGGNRLVISYQAYENRDFVLPRLESIFKTIMQEKATKAGEEFQEAEGEKSLYRSI